MGREQLHSANEGAIHHPWYLTLPFFYGVTFGHAEIPERIAYARSPRTLPVVLSADKVVRFLEAVPSLRPRSRTEGDSDVLGTDEDSSRKPTA